MVYPVGVDGRPVIGGQSLLLLLKVQTLPSVFPFLMLMGLIKIPRHSVGVAYQESPYLRLLAVGFLVRQLSGFDGLQNIVGHSRSLIDDEHLVFGMVS